MTILRNIGLVNGKDLNLTQFPNPSLIERATIAHTQPRQMTRDIVPNCRQHQ